MILINLLPHREAARKLRRDIFNVSLGASALAGGLIAVGIFLWFQAQIAEQRLQLVLQLLEIDFGKRLRFRSHIRAYFLTGIGDAAAAAAVAGSGADAAAEAACKAFSASLERTRRTRMLKLATRFCSRAFNAIVLPVISTSSGLANQGVA